MSKIINLKAKPNNFTDIVHHIKLFLLFMCLNLKAKKSEKNPKLLHKYKVYKKTLLI